MQKKPPTAKTLAFAALICLFTFTACSANSAPSGGPAPMNNMVTPKALTQDQQDIVDLLTNNDREILLFDFKTQDVYKSVEFWAETYEYGVLKDRPSGANTFSDEAQPLDGQLAVVVSNDDTGLQWSFTLSHGGTRTTHSSAPAMIDNALARGFGPVSGPVEIEDGKEIVLYSALYSYGSISTHDEQAYVSQPELLAEYPLAHLIKCRFAR